MDDISDDELFLDAVDKVALEALAAIGDDSGPTPGILPLDDVNSWPIVRIAACPLSPGPGQPRRKCPSNSTDCSIRRPR
jgi:hypothetical protein